MAQYVMFPSREVNITQSENGSLSHKGKNAIDWAGINTGKSWLFAPFDGKIKKVSGSNMFFWSTSKVLFADGTLDYATLYCYHMDNTSMLRTGARYKQYHPLYQEGTYGKASGNHVHLQICKGHTTSGVTIYGSWSLKGAIPTNRAFWYDDTYKTYNKGWNGNRGYKKVPKNTVIRKDIHKFISSNGRTYYFQWSGNSKVVEDLYKRKWISPGSHRYLMEFTRTTNIYLDENLTKKDTSRAYKGERVVSHNINDKVK